MSKIVFEGCFNFRDVGGVESRYGGRVRSGRLYRADSLHRMTRRDVAVLSDLGVKSIVDLRTDAEFATTGGLPARSSPIDTWRAPMSDRSAEADVARRTPWTVAPTLAERAERYLAMVHDFAPSVVAALTVVADGSRLPTVVHCSAGRDRTGVVIALALMLLGVTDDDIVADYALTQHAKQATEAWVFTNEPATMKNWARYPADLHNTYPATMRLFLSRFHETYPTADRYLATAMGTAGLGDRLRRELLT